MANDREDSQGEFRVVDRRRFTSSGETRGDGKDPEPTRFSPTPEPSRPAPKAEPQVEAAHDPEDAKLKAQIAESYSAHGPASVEFSEFVLSLATQAMVLLGEMPDPHTREMITNMEGARHTIDILGILEQKTRGNLTPEESRLFSEALATIRLAFVRKTRPGQSSK